MKWNNKNPLRKSGTWVRLYVLSRMCRHCEDRKQHSGKRNSISKISEKGLNIEK